MNDLAQFAALLLAGAATAGAPLSVMLHRAKRDCRDLARDNVRLGRNVEAMRQPPLLLPGTARTKRGMAAALAELARTGALLPVDRDGGEPVAEALQHYLAEPSEAVPVHGDINLAALVQRVAEAWCGQPDAGIREVDPVDGFRRYEQVPGGDLVDATTIAELPIQTLGSIAAEAQARKAFEAASEFRTHDRQSAVDDSLPEAFLSPEGPLVQGIPTKPAEALGDRPLFGMPLSVHHSLPPDCIGFDHGRGDTGSAVVFQLDGDQPRIVGIGSTIGEAIADMERGQDAEHGRCCRCRQPLEPGHEALLLCTACKAEAEGAN